ncbi:UV radiation resistance protein/autophagy-related protein 14 [Penicillium verhagenii]|uniref:UV radiation resistance protein/autophagy-related protein 14 n=1 Tax=Penicillium verhagenii TaxID=1562060 RepID=UPI0025459D1A|nr:UV radiation resistance protein/autophagy-related protein 14 [Penicillium verhagenii]KAJ5939045.1 UV radiation resistance protein/autophagy-related protein 14 [Penicillium verhagenii]
MDSVVAATEHDGPSRRERPWLYASNRRLRHLNGLSVRNLVVAPPTNRARGKTIDDDDIPNSLKSASKILAQNETHHSLHPSRSFTELNSRANQQSHAGPNPTTKREPRRRSLLPWNDPNPRTRQVSLEDITKSRMADTWVSMHCDGIDEPIYVSEVVNKATNPSFRSFDLNFCGPGVSRRDTLTLKLWAKTEKMAEYLLLVELQLNLRSLQFLGKTIESFHHPLPANSIIFHFPDGVYTNLTDLPSIEPLVSRTGQRATIDGSALSTSSYDALMRLANLDECVQDALATREKLEVQIGDILKKNDDAIATQSDAAKAQDRLASIKQAVAAERKQLRASAKRKGDLIASIKSRKEAMEQGRTAQDKARSHLPDAQEKLVSSEQLLHQNSEDSKGQIRRIAEDLMVIYPIEPIPDKTLAFTIAGLPLPNSDFEDINRDVVAAALGFTAHVVYLLSFYLSVVIPYPVSPNQSISLIQDHISANLPQRVFPLYPVSVHYRFEYAVFLLNKDIEFLLNKCGIRGLDIRHTLPNLKYLLYILTAGTPEIPARKAGGIRGLLGGKMTPNLSRRASTESTASGELVPARKAWDLVAKMNGSLALDHGAKLPAPTNRPLASRVV